MALFFPPEKTIGKILQTQDFSQESLFYMGDVKGREQPPNPVALTSRKSHSKLDLKSSFFSSEAEGGILLTGGNGEVER